MLIVTQIGRILLDFKPFHETVSKMRGFKMGSLNINSIVKYIDELRVVMLNQPLDILAINESKLDDNDSDNMLSLDGGYILVRRGKNKQGGGVCVYLRDSLSFKRLHEFEEKNLELIALEIQKPNTKPFLFTAWYRPPKLDSPYFKYLSYSWRK